ncbi:U3 small nucleolar RNA-associated protein 10 [Pestalotiopsis fici W106-1]|uniref:U3 small nucleolar RNA-associated protein 10 n=1 Tax=Pestalotiopsis fici (strain W106-1 / CGMCC3.15140) TaxID=1229662 RepID=W3XF34_PESFW|nr:U3 small nucleolar RNA-associated protein 10 [Pestalotiopsis fici W106-1]ETS84708.1 U3 small nucleolar RNA-associated protein 10 [Pestalotiopsis fici W106-1]
MSSLAAQLAQIAANSKTTLDVRAQKAAHSKSLIFEPRVAASQSYHSLYKICREGFDELCQLDARFGAFASTIFSEQSQDEDRNQMTAAENAELDKRIESFLRLVGGRLRLMPAIRSVEWLVRRFRIHEYNTAAVLSTFLPYHSIQVFVTLMSILPAKIPDEYRFLSPYIRSLTAPPRSVLVYQATHHADFLTTISEHTLETCRHQQHYPALISFWGGIMIEAVNGMLDKMRSGRKTIQKSNDQAILHLIGPILSEAMVLKKVPSLQIASYMVIVAFVCKGNLDDATITALMEQLVTGWTTETLRPGLVCLSIMAQYRSPKQMSRKVTKALLNVTGLPEILDDIRKEHKIEKLSNGFCLALIDRIMKKGDTTGLQFIEAIVPKQILSNQQLSVVFKSLMLAAHRVDDSVDENGMARQELAATIVRLSQTTGAPAEVFAKAIMDTEIDVEALELRLDTKIRPKALPQTQEGPEETVDANGDVPMAPEDFDTIFDRVNQHATATATSCLLPTPPDVFTDLCSLYLSAVPDRGNLATFQRAAAVQRGEAPNNPFFFTFLIRIWCGPYPTLARSNALDMAKDRIKSGDCESVDFQSLLPYCVASLSDPAKKVRRSAADLITVLDGLAASNPEPSTHWATRGLYGKAEPVTVLEKNAVRKLLQSVLMPSLEECVLNAEHIHAVVQSSLGSSSRSSADGSEKDKKSHMSHGIRLAVLTFLAGHVVETPLLPVKLRLLQPINQVKGVSGTTRTTLLLPLLKWWASLSPETASQLCKEQNVSESAMDTTAVETVVPNDNDGLEYLLQSVQTPALSSRENLLHAVFLRIEKMWPSMKTETRHVVADRLLAMAQENASGERSPVATEAADVLRNVELATENLLSFLDSLQNAAKMANETPPNKRRRTSSSESRGAVSQADHGLTQALRQVTFVLQLVEGSDPAKHPHILNALFNTLSELQHFRTLLGSELGYLQNLVLRSLLAIVPAYRDDKTLKIDGSSGHGDLLVSCIQKSSSPAVQNTALLLVASLASVAPELVLHSVMPIFTFMGNSVLRQSDDYSAHVINQTVKEVVPPLIQSLRRGKKSPVAGAAELLLSFVTAFEHIPSHRRLGLFVSLLEVLGAEDFLFALLAMLVDKYGSTADVLSFASQVFHQFSVEVELQTVIKLLNLTGDLFQSRPTLSTALLSTSEDRDRDPQKIALAQLDLPPRLLSSKKLITQIAKMTEKDDMEAAKIRELYSTLLEDLLSLAESLKPYKALHDRCGDSLPKLLNLLPIGEFVKAVENLLDRPDIVIRRKVLRALQVRIDREGQADALSRTALLAFLPQLTAIIRTSDDMAYKYVAVECVDVIAQKYGKKDPEAVSAAAMTIAGDQCLGQSDVRLRSLGLLCLASLVDVLQDGMVPVLPVATPKCLVYLKESVADAARNTALHNACYTFMHALAQHLPYMLSGTILQQLLAVSSESAAAELDTDAIDSRVQCLQFLAKTVEAKAIFTALEVNWAVASDSGFNAIMEYLDILGLAIDKHSKSDIAKNVSSLSNIFLSALDLRRVEHGRGEISKNSARNLARIEDTINAVALRMVYKLNDAAFRPIFSSLMDWAVGPDLPSSDLVGRNLRLLGAFSFLLSFFDSLKSIVTSYASYMVDPAVATLQRLDPKQGGEQKDLWRKILSTLAKCFEHDQDDFWQAPAHFSVVAPVLTSQLLHASSTGAVDMMTHDLVPTLVELAAAADSQDHHKELNAALLKHLRSESAGIRLAAVKAEQKLTERLGEDWLAMLPEMLPYISELQEDDEEDVERETQRWIVGIEGILGENLDAMLH